MPFQCPDCDKVFAKKGYLQNHKVFHTGEKRYKCDVCDKRFSNSSNRKTHMRIHTGEQPYQCALCDRSFTQASQLTLHKRLHSGERPYICDFCGKGFVNNACKVRHTRVHTGERPYQCVLCGKSFGVASHLRRHMRIHTGEKPYKCGVCDKTFAESAQVDKHIRSCHTREKPYKCDICCKAFAEVSSRNRHVRAHTGVKSHKCMICSKSFSHSWHLNTHVLTHKSEMASLMVDGIGASSQLPFKGPSGLMHFKDLAALNAKRNLAKVDGIPSAKVDISPAMIEKAIDACAVMGKFDSKENPTANSNDTNANTNAAGIAENKSELDTVSNPNMVHVPSRELTNSYVIPTELPPKDLLAYNTCPVQMPSKELQIALDICTNSSVQNATRGIEASVKVKHCSGIGKRQEDNIESKTDNLERQTKEDCIEIYTQKDKKIESVGSINEIENNDTTCMNSDSDIESGNETEDYDVESENDAEFLMENETDVKNEEVDSDQTEDYVESEDDIEDERTEQYDMKSSNSSMKYGRDRTGESKNDDEDQCKV